jgi:hypothetical protein
MIVFTAFLDWDVDVHSLRLYIRGQAEVPVDIAKRIMASGHVDVEVLAQTVVDGCLDDIATKMSAALGLFYEDQAIRDATLRVTAKRRLDAEIHARLVAELRAAFWGINEKLVSDNVDARFDLQARLRRDGTWRDALSVS